METIEQITVKKLKKIADMPSSESDRMAIEMLTRVKTRESGDPGLKLLVRVMSAQCAAYIRESKAVDLEVALRGQLLATIMMWEEINNEFNDHLKPAPQTP